MYHLLISEVFINKTKSVDSVTLLVLKEEIVNS